MRPDRNGWYFRPEPRTFNIVATCCDGAINMTQTVYDQPRSYTLWFYDLPIAEGRREMVLRVFNKWAGPDVRNNR